MNPLTLREEYYKWYNDEFLKMEGLPSQREVADYFLAIIEADRAALREKLEKNKTNLLLFTGTKESYILNEGYNLGINDAIALIHKTLDV